MEDDSWDLSAVVRSCRPSEPAAGTREARWLFPSPAGPVLAVESGKGGAFMRLTDAFGGLAGVLEMGELCNKSLFPGGRQPPQLQERSCWSPPLVAAATAAATGPQQTPPRRKADRPASQTPRSRRRKNQLKKVVRHVAVDGLSSDTWAWRKYGQKPIKGSPYPRGYYRCSSSKGCPARKQVERCRVDPATFIVTYTSEHNHPMPTHRNSLAGSTRHKFSSPAAGAAASGGDPTQTSNSEASPLSSTTVPELSPITPRPHSEDIVDEEEVEEEEDDEDERELLVEDMEVMGEDDLFFLSSEEGGPALATVAEVAAFDGKDDFEDHLLPLPWLTSNCSNTAASAAAGAFSSS